MAKKTRFGNKQLIILTLAAAFLAAFTVLITRTGTLPISNSIQTSGWKTFSTSNYNLEFKYPKKFVARESNSLDNGFGVGIFVSLYEENPSRWLRIEPVTKTSEKNLLNLKVGESYDATTKRLPDIELGGKTAMVFEATQGWEIPGPIKILLVPQTGDQYLKIRATYSNDDETDYITTFDQILSTLKFFDDKTYTNNEHHFSLQYPGNWVVDEVEKPYSETSAIAYLNDELRNSISVYKFELKDLPKGYNSVSSWFDDLKAKNKKALDPNDEYTRGPGSDTPYEWYMYLDLKDLKNYKINNYAALVVGDIGKNGTHIVVLHNDAIFEISTSPLNYYDGTRNIDRERVKEVLNSFKFLN